MGCTTGEITEAVVLAVADATRQDALALPPLGASIDPDVLDGIVDRTTSGEVSFTYAGQRVRVTHDGEIDVWNALPVRRSSRATAISRAGD